MKKDIKYVVLLSCVFLLYSFTNAFGLRNNNAENKLTEFVLNNGEIVKLADLKGKVVLLDFWYRGCLPCLKATPDLIKLQKEFKNDLVIIGINDKDTNENVTDYYAYKKVNYFSTYKSEKDISRSLKINAFPTFIIINKKGEVVYTEVGFDKSRIKKTIKELIKD